MAKKRKIAPDLSAHDETVADDRGAFVPLNAVGFQRGALALLREYIPSGRTSGRLTIDYHEAFPESLARVIRLARDEQGLAQHDLAERVTRFLRSEDGEPITQSWVSKNEHRANPSLDRVIGLAAALQLTPGALILAAEVDHLLRAHGHEPGEGWDAIVAKLLDSFMRDVRRGGIAFPEKERKVAAAWQRPTADLVARTVAAIGGAIRRRRYIEGYTLDKVVKRAEELKLRSEFSKPYLSQIETGAGRPSLARLGLLARLLPRSRPRIFGDPADDRGVSAFAEDVESPVSDIFHEAEIVALREENRADELQALKKRFEQCVSLIDRLVDQNENGEIEPLRVENALKNAPLLDVMYSNMAAEEPKTHRPGRPKKP